MRLIAADALKEEWIKDTGRAFPADYFIFTIDRSPTIDAAPVVRGRWVGKTPETRHEYVYPLNYKCSNCGFLAKYDGWRYCPNCGAKMDGGTDNG